MNTSTLSLFGHAHRDQFARGAVSLVVDQYSDRTAAARNRLSEHVKADTSTGVYFDSLAAGGPLDAPRLPRGSFARSWMFDEVVCA